MKKSFYLFIFLITIFISHHPIQSKEILKPRLVVIISVDQLRYDYITRYPDLFTGGFKMALDKGSFYSNAHYNHACTQTSVGHACIGTGVTPDKHGIVMNNWYDRDVKRVVYSCEDTSMPLWSTLATIQKENRVLNENEKKAGRSPHRLMAMTFGDALKVSYGTKAKVYSISHKDRSAILMGGKKANGAFWINRETGEYTSSLYYGKNPPKWLNDFNTYHPSTAFFGKEWTKLLSEEAYSISRPDNDSYERDPEGLGIIFPHPIRGVNNKIDNSFIEAFLCTPYATEHLLKLAETIIDNEKLGQDTVPDILCVGISTNDSVGHSYGPYSQEVQDLMVQTDRYLGDFFNYLDIKVGLQNTLIFITSDHGVCPIPEIMKEMGYDAGRFPSSILTNTINQDLKAEYGLDKGLINFSDPCFYLDREQIKSKGLSLSGVQLSVVHTLHSIPQVGNALSEHQILSGEYRKNEITDRFTRSIYPGRSGDIIYCPKPFWILGNPGSKGTTHGTPYPYDTHVPILTLGYNIPKGEYSRLVGIEDIAPTIATILGVELSTSNQRDLLYELIQ